MSQDTESMKDGTMDDVERMLGVAREIYAERDAKYGSKWKRAGKVYAALFPDGVRIESAEDFQRYQMLSWCISKLVRYSSSFEEGGHFDSAVDLINYATFLALSTAEGPHVNPVEQVEFPYGDGIDRSGAYR